MTIFMLHTFRDEAITRYSTTSGTGLVGIATTKILQSYIEGCGLCRIARDKIF